MKTRSTSSHTAPRGPPARKTSNKNSASSLSSDPDTADGEDRPHEEPQAVGRVKYKTELCHNFSQTGYCPYEKRCQFAHGPSQLHSPVERGPTNFRTKKCKSFWSSGCCLYGPRCQFSHSQPPPPHTSHYLRICEVALVGSFRRADRSYLLKLIESQPQREQLL